MMHRLAFLLMLVPPIVMADPWPTVEHPGGARVEHLGQHVRLNGVPMRMTRTLSAAPADELAAHYRSALGAPVAHSRVGATEVLAQRRGDHFITVTIATLPGGASEALLSIADLHGAREAGARPPGFMLPGGSELLSDMESIDGPVSARQLVVMNAHDLHANLGSFSASLAERGLRPAGPPQAVSDDALVQGFEGQNGDARLVLVRRDGTTSAILTLLSRHP